MFGSTVDTNFASVLGGFEEAHIFSTAPLASGSPFVAASPEEYKNLALSPYSAVSLVHLWYMLMRQSTAYWIFTFST